MPRFISADVLRRRIAFDQHWVGWSDLRIVKFWEGIIHAPTIAMSAEIAQGAPARARRRAQKVATS